MVEKKKGRSRGPENRCNRPFVAWNQVDAIIVAMRVPNRKSG
jgi:hypothetical protein